MSIYLNIFISVLSGVISASLLFAAKSFLFKVTIPWYRSMIYNGLDISGKWNESHNYGDLDMIIQDSTITIKQTANTVRGKIILNKKTYTTKEIVETKTFNFKGDFYDGFLNITCLNDNKKQIGTINYLMKISGDGQAMKGIKSSYDIGTEDIEQFKINWIRKNGLQ